MRRNRLPVPCVPKTWTAEPTHSPTERNPPRARDQEQAGSPRNWDGTTKAGGPDIGVLQVNKINVAQQRRDAGDMSFRPQLTRPNLDNAPQVTPYRGNT